MNSAQHIVRLKPIAVELIDRTMIGLARQIPIFQPTLDKFVREEIVTRRKVFAAAGVKPE